ncbi:MAG: hypothetical protein EOO10_13730, partial [Chitinophagaceae bacterium]
MNIGRLALLTVFVLLSQALNAEFKGKIRAVTMVIEKSFLEGIKEEETLFFTTQYHNRGFAKDQILLSAYVGKQEKNYPAQPRDLGTIGKGEKFINELRYSIYQLSKEEIKTILSFYSKANGSVYFLLEPVKFKGDNRYLCYRIRPADERKKIILFEQTIEKQKGGNNRLWRETALFLNPSPPAT